MISLLTISLLNMFHQDLASVNHVFSSFPANIRLDEDVLKTSLVFVFRRRLQDVLIKTNIFTLVTRLHKTSSRRLQDVLVKTNTLGLGDTSSRRFQNVFKTSCKNAFKTSSRRLQDVFKTSSRHLQDVFKISSRRLAKMSSRHFQDVS